MENRFLSMAEASSIFRNNPPTGEWDDFLDLSAYSQADPKAVELLATQSHKVGVTLGLINLDIQVASVIANWNVITEFTNLAHLSREAAALLSEITAPLSIKGLREIDVGVASELSKNISHLSISC